MAVSEHRPTAQSVFAEHATTTISEWLQRALKPLPLDTVKKVTGDLDAEDPDQTIAAMLLSAAQNAVLTTGRLDAYRIAKQFEEHLDWPVTGEMVALLQRSVDYADSFGIKQKTREWVMRSGIRFPGALDQTATFNYLAGTRLGKVVSIDRGLAQAQVSLFGDVDNVVTVNAEDVTRCGLL